MNTSIELVPRTREQLLIEIDALDRMDIPYHGLNLPELRRPKGSFLSPEELMTMRARGVLAPEKDLTLHLRTCDLPVAATIQRLQEAARSSVSCALLISGDRMSGQEGYYAHDVLPYISEHCTIPLAIGIDPYQPEFGRWSRKIDAIQRGVVSSVFTQPLFHPQQIEDVLRRTDSLLPRSQLFIGTTWLAGSRSRSYWHQTNAVPLSLLAQGEADDTIRKNSIAQAIDLLHAASSSGCSTYIMLMRGTLEELRSILEKASS